MTDEQRMMLATARGLGTALDFSANGERDPVAFKIGSLAMLIGLVAAEESGGQMEQAEFVIDHLTRAAETFAATLIREKLP